MEYQMNQATSHLLASVAFFDRRNVVKVVAKVRALWTVPCASSSCLTPHAFLPCVVRPFRSLLSFVHNME